VFENSDKQQVLRLQHRLLSLRHAAKCPHDGGQCPVTHHCAGMKRLWKHMAVCKDQKCLVPYCISSRSVLSHYRRCKDARCRLCGPVRETIHRSRETTKHKQAIQQQNMQTQALKKNNATPTPALDPSAQEAHLQITTLAQAPVSAASALAQQPPQPQQHQLLIQSQPQPQLQTQLHQHPPAKLKVECLEVLKGLQSHVHGWVFNGPVDPVDLGLHDYFDVIKRPMDLGTIKKRLENGCYHELKGFGGDVNLTFDNAMLYNPEGSVVWNMAKELKDKFCVDFENLARKANTAGCLSSDFSDILSLSEFSDDTGK